MIPALAAYAHPSALLGLSWDTARPLAAAVVSVYPKGPTVFLGERFVLFLLLASQLPITEEATPSELLEWVGLGAVRGARSVYGYVRRKLSDRLRSRIRRRLAEEQSTPPSAAEPDLEGRLDVEKAIETLPLKTQEILAHLANQGSAQGWAEQEQIPLRTARYQIAEARKALQGALLKLS